MQALVNFSLSFFFSFTGSLSPGTVNLSCIQLGLEHKARLAWRFALAAAMVEYAYAFLAVTFEKLITSSPLIIRNFHLLAAIVMLTLGVLTIRSVAKPSNFSQRFQNSGFRKGLMLGILNPLAMPFWIGIVAYLKSVHWVDLTTPLKLHAFLLGVSAGVFTLLVLATYLANRALRFFKENTTIRKIPGYLMLVLGTYALVRYFIMLYNSTG